MDIKILNIKNTQITTPVATKISRSVGYICDKQRSGSLFFLFKVSIM